MALIAALFETKVSSTNVPLSQQDNDYVLVPTHPNSTESGKDSTNATTNESSSTITNSSENEHISPTTNISDSFLSNVDLNSKDSIINMIKNIENVLGQRKRNSSITPIKDTSSVSNPTHDNFDNTPESNYLSLTILNPISSDNKYKKKTKLVQRKGKSLNEKNSGPFPEPPGLELDIEDSNIEGLTIKNPGEIGLRHPLNPDFKDNPILSNNKTTSNENSTIISALGTTLTPFEVPIQSLRPIPVNADGKGKYYNLVFRINR